MAKSEINPVYITLNVPSLDQSQLYRLIYLIKTLSYQSALLSGFNFTKEFKGKRLFRAFIWDLLADKRGASLQAILVQSCKTSVSWQVRLEKTRQSHVALLQLPLRGSLIQNNSNSNTKLLHPSAYLWWIRIESSLQKKFPCIEMNWPFEWECKSQRGSAERGSDCSRPASLLTLIWLFKLELKENGAEVQRLVVVATGKTA